MATRPKNVLLLWTDQQRANTVGPDKDQGPTPPHAATLVTAFKGQAYPLP